MGLEQVKEAPVIIPTNTKGEYLTASVTSQSEGNININIGVDKFMLSSIIASSNSTNYNLKIYSKDDFTSNEITIAELLSGNEVIQVELPYEDEDATNELHIKYTDENGTDTINLEIRGFKLE